MPDERDTCTLGAQEPVRVNGDAQVGIERADEIVCRARGGTGRVPEPEAAVQLARVEGSSYLSNRPTTIVEQQRIAESDAGNAGRQRVGRLLHEIRSTGVVGIEEDDDVTPRPSNTLVPGVGYSGISFAVPVGEPIGVPLDDGSGTIGAPPVDDDDLDRLKRLPEGALERVFDGGDRILDGHHDRDETQCGHQAEDEGHIKGMQLLPARTARITARCWVA